MPVPQEILKLVERFDAQREAYQSGKYNEAQIRAEFIDPLFKALGWDIHNELGYAEAYKDVTLIQVANHRSEHALPIQFVHYDKLTQEEKKSLGHVVAMVKFKDVPVLNPDLLKPGEVVRRVQAGLGNPKIVRAGKQIERFNLDTHVRCWRRYKVCPPKVASDPRATDYRYCVYDKMHDDYGYTQAWIDLLVEELKGETEWNGLYRDGN